jgi:hypothetical protein
VSRRGCVVKGEYWSLNISVPIYTELVTGKIIGTAKARYSEVDLVLTPDGKIVGALGAVVKPETGEARV